MKTISAEGYKIVYEGTWRLEGLDHTAVLWVTDSAAYVEEDAGTAATLVEFEVVTF